jgi:hypothetical protein
MDHKPRASRSTPTTLPYARGEIRGRRPELHEVRTTLTDDIARFESQIEISTADSSACSGRHERGRSRSG